MAQKNGLIKQSILVAELKKSGIKRISAKAKYALEIYLTNHLHNAIYLLKKRLAFQGRKTLTAEDVEKALSGKEAL